MQHHLVSDLHLHSSFSGDSDTPMEEMILAGIRLGLKQMCFTEHLDLDYPSHPEDSVDFSLDISRYEACFREMKQKYQDQIELLFGIELGLQPHLSDTYRELLERHSFDFVIGSSHTACGEDPYYSDSYFRGISEQEGYRRYFSSILENIRVFSGLIDTYGHLDYVVRYGPNRNRFYSYEAYQEILDPVLHALIDSGIALEVNTGGLKYGLGHPNPCEEIIQKYYEFGGRRITIGSDAHNPEYLGYRFPEMEELLRGTGFSHYTVFRGRKPVFLPL